MIKSGKQIIFFDGDGTLWYPKKTKYTKRPHWVYLHDKRGYKLQCDQLMLIPTVVSTLKKLKKMGIITVVLSTHPHPPKEATKVLNHKVKYFKLGELFDEVCATRFFHSSKGEFISRILKKHQIPKTKALMVGDSYSWDYKPAKDVGVEALMLESDYMKIDDNGRRIKKTIRNLKEILEYI